MFLLDLESRWLGVFKGRISQVLSLFLMCVALFSYCSIAMNLLTRFPLLALITTTIIFSGCAEKAKAETTEVRVVTSDKIQVRADLYYEVNQTTPFTGLVQDFYSNGQMKSEWYLKDGKKIGVGTLWYENGQKELESISPSGNDNGSVTLWYENGVKKE